jgi:hypothetical protein
MALRFPTADDTLTGERALRLRNDRVLPFSMIVVVVVDSLVRRR